MSPRNAIVTGIAAIAIAVPVVVVIADIALGWPSGGSYLLFAPSCVAFAAVGWLVSVRRPENLIGPLLLTVATLFAMYFPIDLLVRLGSPPLPVQVAATFSSASDAPGFILMALVLALFPDGRLPGPGWRWVPIVAGVGIIGVTIGSALNAGPLAVFPSVENPLGVPGFPGATIGEVGYLCLNVLLIGSIAALVTRWRRGSATERAQIKWVGAAALLLVVTAGINFATFETSDPFGSALATVLATVAAALVPIAIGIAILRYRLYEIDRIISRTIGWALVTGLLVAVFALLVVGLQTPLAGLTQGDTVAVAASTLVAFALIQPVRRSVQRAVDRRFDRARYDAEHTATRFADRLRDQVDLDLLVGDLESTVDASFRPTIASTWIARPGP
jgi:hypothetical protein